MSRLLKSLRITACYCLLLWILGGAAQSCALDPTGSSSITSYSLPLSGQHFVSGQTFLIRTAYVADFNRAGEPVLSSRLYPQGTEIYAYPQQKQAIDRLSQRRKHDRLRIILEQDQDFKIGDKLSDIYAVVVKQKPLLLKALDYNYSGVALNSPYQHRDKELKLSFFNLENYFNGDKGRFAASRGAKNQRQLKRQQNKLVMAMKALNADIISLNEIENDGNQEGSAIAQLTKALSQASGKPYQFVKTGRQLGSDAITVGQLYRADRVTPIAEAHSLTFNYLHRPLLLQAYRFRQFTFSVATTHLKSKAGSCAGDGKERRYLAACNQEREKASRRIVNYLSRYQVRFQNKPLILMADLNSYSKEPPLAIFKAAGFMRAGDLITDTSPLRFGYRYRGALGNLDHALLNPAAQKLITTRTSWAINSTVNGQYNYRNRNLTAKQVATPVGSSDHDPLSIILNFD